MLDDFGPAEITPAAGCQGVSPDDSWVTVGDRRRLVGGADGLHPPTATTEPIPRLPLRSADIEAAQFGLDGSALVRLGPAARQALAEFTDANVGRVVVITIDGVVASARVTVQGAIRSGIMIIDRSVLRGALCEILRSAPRRDVER